MDQENQESSLITWIVITGIILTIIVAISAYLIANPDSIAQLFGHKTPIVKPVAPVNGAPTTQSHVQPAHTKHYANSFIEFDYPDNFTISDELVNKTRTEGGGVEDAFGYTEAIFTATGTLGAYSLHVTTIVNSDHSSAEQVIKNAKADFFSRQYPGMNDSFQDITVINRPGYKYFTEGHIHLGVPTEILLYSADITWDPTVSASTANGYLGIIEDSFILK